MVGITLCNLFAIFVVFNPPSLLLFSTFDTTAATPVPSNIEGYYQLTSNPQDPAYNEYLKALGVNEQFRQVMTRLKMHVQVTKAGDNSYTYKVITPFVSRSTTFKFGKELEDEFVDKRKYKTTFVLESANTVKQTLKFDNITATSVYTFSQDGLNALETANDKSVARSYKRIKK